MPRALVVALGAAAVAFVLLHLLVGVLAFAVKALLAVLLGIAVYVGYRRARSRRRRN